ncbi:MAG: prepilin peptidase [Hyphomonadaceae bacterium]|nr:prepilin peptidase [Hyphomonadaceae bacterium]
MFDLAILTVFPAAVAFAGAMDLFTMTIPNRISLALVAGFVALAPLAGLGLGDMALHAGAGLLVLVSGVLLFIPGWIGGGDAKLAAAVALWLGFDHLFPYLLCVALAGGSLAMLFITVRSYPLPAFVCAEPWAVRLHDRRSGVPYGIALAAGALLVYPTTSWFALG